MDADSLDDFGGGGMPTCPSCLIRMDIRGTEDDPYLLCSTCGLVRITE